MKSFLPWLCWAYVAIVTLWLILRLLFFDRLWWVALINYVAIYLFVPLPLLLAASLWKRRWRLLLGLSIPIVAFILLYGMLFVPQLPSVKPGRPITAMSFNVMLGNQDYAPLASAIRASKADIVGLQELTPELAKPLMQELAKDYPYNTLTLVEGKEAETEGIVSRFPIETMTVFPLPGRRYGMHLDTKTEFLVPGSRLGVRAALRVDGKRIQVVSVDGVHNPTPKTPLNQIPSVAKEHYAQKAAEIELLERELRKDGDPFLLLCDCNLADTSEAYARLTTFAKDSFREVGWGLGHTVKVEVGMFDLPIGQRMDYIWHSNEFTVTEAVVGPDGGSDHWPVVAKFRFEGGQGGANS